MSLTETDSFYLSIDVSPRTQNKDSPEDSVSTSPDPSKRGRLMEGGGVWVDGQGTEGEQERALFGGEQPGRSRLRCGKAVW